MIVTGRIAVRKKATSACGSQKKKQPAADAVRNIVG
jgi:hypothetical protein